MEREQCQAEQNKRRSGKESVGFADGRKRHEDDSMDPLATRKEMNEKQREKRDEG